MNKLTKGAIAAAAGVVLLLGGGGTLAYWNAEATGAASSITSGVLEVASAGAATVSHANGDALTLAVPGDTIVIEQDLTLNATGDNLKFTIAVDEASITGDQDLIDELVATASYSVDGGSIAETTSGSNVWEVVTGGASTVTVTLTITWDFGNPAVDPADNGSQNKTVSFAGVDFLVEQVQ